MGPKRSKQGKLPPRWFKSDQGNASLPNDIQRPIQNDSTSPELSSSSQGSTERDQLSASAENDAGSLTQPDANGALEITRQPGFEKVAKFRKLFENYFDYDGHKEHRFNVSCKTCKRSLTVDESSAIWNCSRHYKVKSDKRSKYQLVGHIYCDNKETCFISFSSSIRSRQTFLMTRKLTTN
jgi:hypothetical protein